MRAPHTSQPAVNLGDDPDLAAEIGQRMAAGSQTAQGLLTNYLFYGQRRQSDARSRVAGGDRNGHAHEDAEEADRTTRISASRREASYQEQHAQAPPTAADLERPDIAAAGGRIPRVTFHLVPDMRSKARFGSPAPAVAAGPAESPLTMTADSSEHRATRAGLARDGLAAAGIDRGGLALDGLSAYPETPDPGIATIPNPHCSQIE